MHRKWTGHRPTSARPVPPSSDDDRVPLSTSGRPQPHPHQFHAPPLRGLLLLPLLVVVSAASLACVRRTVSPLAETLLMKVDGGMPLEAIAAAAPVDGERSGGVPPPPRAQPPTVEELDCPARLRARREACRRRSSVREGGSGGSDKQRNASGIFWGNASAGITSKLLVGAGASDARAPPSVVYYDHPRRAGMRDVLSVLMQLGNLASSLCGAGLVLRPPGGVFRHDLHNGGKEIPATVPYADYLQMVSQLVAEVEEDDDTGEGERLGSTVAGEETLILDGVSLDDARKYGTHLERTGEGLYLHLGLRDNATVYMEQYRQLVRAADKGLPFVWGIHTNIYNVREKFLEDAADMWRRSQGKKQQQHESDSDGPGFPHPDLNYKIKGCPYVRISNSEPQIRAIESFLGLAGLEREDNGYVPLHIRRNDDHPMCDSSPDALDRYLNCSLNVGCRGRAPVVVFTDEKNATYIEEALRIAEKYSSRAVHGDTVLRDVMQSGGARRSVGSALEDNFFLFSVADALMKRVPHRLVRHRTNCRACDPICPAEEWLI